MGNDNLDIARYEDGKTISRYKQALEQIYQISRYGREGRDSLEDRNEVTRIAGTALNKATTPL